METTSMKENSSKALWIALLSSIAAAGVHLYLTIHYYQLKAGTLIGQSACNINETFNCDVVSLSDFSNILGVPIAILGLITALIVSFLILIFQLNMTSYKKLVGKAISSLCLITVLASVLMGLISIAQLQIYCLFCIITYVLSLVTFASVLKSFSGLNLPQGQDFTGLFKEARWISVLIILIPVASVLGHQMFRSHYKLDKIEEFVNEAISIWESNSKQSFSEKGLKSLKDTTSPTMTIVEFADFKCGHCQQAAPVFAEFKKKHPDVQFIFKNYPLDGVCNDSMIDRNGDLYKGDGTRCVLAQLTYCADQQDKGWVFHDWIFENAKALYSKTEIWQQAQALADQHQVNKEQLKNCLDSRESFEAIQAQVAEGVRAKITGTPTIFVNGRKVPGGQNPIVLEALYQRLK